MTPEDLKPKIAAIILTKDEERDLPGCLESLRRVAAQVYVVDSGSTDATTAVAQQFGAVFLTHPFANYSKQFNWALDKIATDADWILRIDADERLDPTLAQNLLEKIPKLSPEVTGIEIPRRNFFLGRKIRYGDSYPVWLLRLWRNGVGRCEDRWMDEHIELAGGRTERINGDLLHEIPKSLGDWTAKHNWYATRECQDIQLARRDQQSAETAGFRRRLKESVYLRLPLFYRAFFYWFYRYFIKLGFLDGREGLIYHFLQGFWYRFLVDAKLHEASIQSNSKSSKRVDPFRAA